MGHSYPLRLKASDILYQAWIALFSWAPFHKSKQGWLILYSHHSDDSPDRLRLRFNEKFHSCSFITAIFFFLLFENKQYSTIQEVQ